MAIVVNTCHLSNW